MEATYSYLMSKVSKKLLDKLDSDYSINKVNHKLTGQSLLQILLYNICEEDRISLRIIEESLDSHQLNLYHNGVKLRASKSGISARLRTINYKYYQAIFNSLEKTYSKCLGKDIKRNLRIFDSSAITLSSKLLRCGFKVPKGDKEQIKLSIGYNGIPNSIRFGVTTSDGNEDIALKSAIKECSFGEDDVVVFDRGISSRKTFHDFKKSGLSFVTRLNEKALYREIRSNELVELEDEGCKLLEDKIVQLRSKNGWIIDDFRLIKISKEGKKFMFITNLYDLHPSEILGIYKSRWDIEIFFKFIKQHLNAKHFLSRDLNGIKVVLYIILIAALLILTFKKKNNIDSFVIAKKRFVEQLRRAITYDIILIYKDDPSDFKHNFIF